LPHLFRSAPSQNRYYAWFSALHTRIDLLLLGSLSESEFETAETAVRSELLAVEHLGNRFDPGSELSRAVRSSIPAPSLSPVFGGSSAAPPFAEHSPSPLLSPALFNLLARCLQAHRETGGLFDITVNSPDFVPGLINSVELIPDSGSRSGYLRLHNPSIILDLSGILKGYALERLRPLLPEYGITDALINLGNSSILSLGKNPSDIPAGYCLTTSGNATADRRHIRNPLTGEFITGKNTVSVTTANAIDGEIQSTVSFIQSVLNTHN
jgi:thiamine biosynthesis lipoprotein